MKTLISIVILSTLTSLANAGLRFYPMSFGYGCSSCSQISIEDDQLLTPETILKFRQAIASDNDIPLEQVTNRDATLAIAYQLMERDDKE